MCDACTMKIWRKWPRILSSTFGLILKEIDPSQKEIQIECWLLLNKCCFMLILAPLLVFNLKIQIKKFYDNIIALSKMPKVLC